MNVKSVLAKKMEEDKTKWISTNDGGKLILHESGFVKSETQYYKGTM
jgi:hypothetical protein